MSDEILQRPKKLIACCDGTWLNSDDGYVRPPFWDIFGSGHLQTPSNVTRIGRAIVPVDKNHHPQIVYYQAGVGTGFSLTDRLVGGGTGEGVSEHIREAYTFLVHNYTDGDFIFLLGFSRGAFTARSIGGLIGGVGLLKKQALPFFYEICTDWENAGFKKDYKPMLTNYPQFKDLSIKSDSRDPDKWLDEYRAYLLEKGLTREVKIEAIGVWDTVGALGIPTTPLLQMLGFRKFLRDFKFFDTSLGPHVKHAFQALALDEQRSAFSPTLWEQPKDVTTKLKQVWFSGVHSNVGGSEEDTGTADITLAWMMDQLADLEECHIEFDPDYLTEQYNLNRAYNAAHPPPAERAWSTGRLYNSLTFPTNLGGKSPRTPGCYRRTNPITDETEGPLVQTNESMHISVRARLNIFYGNGYEDKGPYDPAALKDWKLDDGTQYRDHRVANGAGAEDQPVKWVYQGKDPAGKGKIMIEEPLGPYERRLLELDQAAAAKILGTVASKTANGTVTSL